MRRAARIDANQPEIVQQLRSVPGVKVCITSQVGGGFPDIIIGYHGANYLIELKDSNKPPSKRKLTPAEKKWHKMWSGYGQIATCITFEECLEAIGIEIYNDIPFQAFDNWRKEDQTIVMAKFVGQNMELYIDDQKFEGMVTSASISSNTDISEETHWGSLDKIYYKGVTHTTGVLEYVIDSVSTMPEQSSRQSGKTYASWKALLDQVDSKPDETFTWADGKGRIYEIKRAIADFSNSNLECLDTEVEMDKRVYTLYAVNRKGGEVLEVALFSGDRDYSTALQTAILTHADAIKVVGDPDVVHVWLEQVGEYKEA